MTNTASPLSLLTVLMTRLVANGIPYNNYGKMLAWNVGGFSLNRKCFPAN